MIFSNLTWKNNQEIVNFYAVFFSTMYSEIKINQFQYSVDINYYFLNIKDTTEGNELTVEVFIWF